MEAKAASALLRAHLNEAAYDRGNLGSLVGASCQAEFDLTEACDKLHLHLLVEGGLHDAFVQLSQDVLESQRLACFEVIEVYVASPFDEYFSLEPSNSASTSQCSLFNKRNILL